jgi:hypothetical protein
MNAGKAGQSSRSSFRRHGASTGTSSRGTRRQQERRGGEPENVLDLPGIMNKFAPYLLAAGGLIAAAMAHAEVSVGVSVGIHQPGLYGRVDIGNYPPPPVVYAQPVVIAPTPVAVYQRPVYLYVPPGHQKNWAKHCARYAACGQPVYFVQEQWVEDRYHDRGGHHGDKRSRKRH